MISIPIIAPESVHRAVLPNGLTVLVKRDDSAPVVAIVSWVKAGYFDETDDVVGIAHVLEHMYFKGTPSRGVGEISKETKAAGGYLNAGTIYDHTSYYTVLPAASARRGLEIQYDAYANSLIDADELRRELEVIIQEAKRKADNPGAVTIETLYELLHDRHRMRRWRIGRAEELRALTREHVLDFYRNFYRPSTTILSIVGDVDPDETLSVVESLYGALPAGEPHRTPGPDEPDRAEFRYRELEGDVSQTHLAFGWRTPGTLDPDTPLLDLAAMVLGAGRASRLYRAVRDRSLAASVASHNYTPTHLGVFLIQADGPPERSVDAARAIWAQLRSLHEGGVGRDELWRARRLLESRWIKRLETMEGQANHLAEWEALGGWQMGERYLERMVTADERQVTEAVRRHLSGERAALIAYRPRHAMPLAADRDAARRMLDGHVEPLPVAPPRIAVAAHVRGDAPPVEREVASMRIYRTTGDVPVLVRRKGGAPLVHLGVFVRGGAVEEDPRVAGLTSLLSRASIKGTERRSADQIAEDAELLGGSIGTVVGAESFGWTMSVPSMHVDAALELLADVVQRATFPDDALETERALALADLALLRDDMYRYPLRMLVGAAYAGHPYGVPASGTEESLGAIDAARVRAWHSGRVLEGALAIGVVGDIDPDRVAECVARCFASVRAAPAPVLEPPSWPAAGASVCEPRDKAQTALALALPSPPRTDLERYPARLLAGIASGLGGRFFDELRDKRSLAYTVTAFASERRLGGMFVSYIATSPEREGDARRGLLDEIAKLRESPVSAEELDRAREFALGTHAIRQQSGAAVLGELLDAWMSDDLEELESYGARVRAVTARDIQALAERWFDEARVVEATVRGSERTV